MKRMLKKMICGGMTSLALCGGSAWASDAQTSARATGGRGPGSATATARYEGDVGFARTDTRTGRVNLARGVAVGFDEDGLSLSLSTAVAPRNGPAFATNFNMTIGANGEVATSAGHSNATGGVARTVESGGRATSTPWGSDSAATAGGHTAHGGRVSASTRSDHAGSPRSEFAAPRIVEPRGLGGMVVGHKIEQRRVAAAPIDRELRLMPRRVIRVR
jgi:hypothetical protein